jgi:hypothetical protein
MTSQAHPSIKPYSVPVIRYVGIVTYCVLMLILYLSKVISYPGTSDIMVYLAWITGPSHRIRLATDYIWLFLCLAASVITVYSIFTL